jgi:hypothetical protein
MSFPESVGDRAPDQRLPAERRVLEVEQALVLERLLQHASDRLVDALIGVRIGEVSQAIAQTGSPPPDLLETLQRREQSLELNRNHRHLPPWRGRRTCRWTCA